MTTNRDDRIVRRLCLRRSDGRRYLERWGLAHKRLGGIMLHRMDAPDPGEDLHDHPWWFVTIPIWGGYTEQRALCRDAPMLASLADNIDTCNRGAIEERRPWRPRVMRLDECHTITGLRRRSSWSIVIMGPVRHHWGFYLSSGWLPREMYEETERGRSRDLWSEAT